MKTSSILDGRTKQKDRMNKQEYSKLLRLIESRNQFSAEKLISKSSMVFLGNGWARKAYKVYLDGYEPFVLKIEWNSSLYSYSLGSSMNCQNYAEINTWLNNNHEFLPDIYDWDTRSGQVRWLEMEYIDTKRKKLPNKNDLTNFISSLSLNSSDASQKKHWGKNSKGELKIVDFGLKRLTLD